MITGYHNKILHVNLTTGESFIEEPGEDFYRAYIGGGAMGAYYVLQNVKPKTDAFDPGNILFFGGSVVSGLPISGFTRHSVCGISPLTGGIVDSESGGKWARGLRSSGFDGIVVRGSAKESVYLLVTDGKVTIKSAAHLWGFDPVKTEETIRSDNGNPKLNVSCIGKAGENMVRFACIMNDGKDANGRGGLGAVMGSKKLKAIAVGGNLFPKPFNSEDIKRIAKSFAQNYMNTSSGVIVKGTGSTVDGMNSLGTFPTFNFKSGQFEQAHNLSNANIHEHIFSHDEACFACVVRCKKALKAETPYFIDEKFGGPEYEALGLLGSNCGISDFNAVCKANELCNRYSLDAISTGSAIALAMECYEKGILTKDDTDGLELNFGNDPAYLAAVEKIADREGFGDFLAEGTRRMAEKLGATDFAMHVKGIDFPAHEPRAKLTFSLTYAVLPVGADHIGSASDAVILPTTSPIADQRLKEIGFYQRASMRDYGPEKALFCAKSSILYSLMDSYDICAFTAGFTGGISFQDMVDALNANTGWDTTFDELMDVGDRRLQMMRAFNNACGMSKEDDMLPQRSFEPTEDSHRNTIDKQEFLRLRELLYGMMGWDENGKPLKSKLNSLNIGWVEELVPSGIHIDTV